MSEPTPATQSHPGPWIAQDVFLAMAVVLFAAVTAVVWPALKRPTSPPVTKFAAEPKCSYLAPSTVSVKSTTFRAQKLPIDHSPPLAQPTDEFNQSIPSPAPSHD